MIYELMGLAHARVLALGQRLEEQRGQGTVEYVGLILLLAVLLAGVVGAAHGIKGGDIPKTVVDKLKEAINSMKLGAK